MLIMKFWKRKNERNCCKKKERIFYSILSFVLPLPHVSVSCSYVFCQCLWVCFLLIFVCVFIINFCVCIIYWSQLSMFVNVFLCLQKSLSVDVHCFLMYVLLCRYVFICAYMWLYVYNVFICFYIWICVLYVLIWVICAYMCLFRFYQLIVF